MSIERHRGPAPLRHRGRRAGLECRRSDDRFGVVTHPNGAASIWKFASRRRGIVGT